MMIPRERVVTALDHCRPDRVPFSWGFGPTAEMTRKLETYFQECGADWRKVRNVTEDKIGAGAAFIGPMPANGNTYSGIWGIQTKSQNYGAGEYDEFTGFPLAGADDPAKLHDYPWPKPEWYDYDKVRGQIETANPGRRKAVCVGGGNPFEIYCWMTGLEESLVNLLTNPEVVTTALDYITGFFEERLRRTLKQCGDLVDLIFFADDLGGQNGLLISRETYRSVLQPFHRRLTACARELAPQAACMLHSDGAVFDILPDLMDAGIQVLEAVQVDAQGMDPERLKSAYGERLSFHGAISVQQLLPHSDAATVQSVCRKLIETLGKNGGYIAAPAHAIQVGTPPENVWAMLEAVLGKADFEQVLHQAKL